MLERWRTLGIGPAFLKLRGRIVYREQDLEEYERQCLHTSTSTSVGPESARPVPLLGESRILCNTLKAIATTDVYTPIIVACR